MAGINTPGSPEAIAEGCICPQMDNNHGKGAFIQENGEMAYWYNLDCPIHGNAKPINSNILLREIDETE